MNSSPTLEGQARHLDEMIDELEKAIAHAKTAAAHFRSAEVPRGCAHVLATEGHLLEASEQLSSIAKAHRIQAKP